MLIILQPLQAVRQIALVPKTQRVITKEESVQEPVTRFLSAALLVSCNIFVKVSLPSCQVCGKSC